MLSPPLFRVLPPGGVHLPRYFELFLQQVGRAAHRYVHLHDDIPFNLGRFNKDMREAMYNTQRNEKKRLAANSPVSGEPQKKAASAKASSPAANPIVIPDDDDGGVQHEPAMQLTAKGDNGREKEAPNLPKKDDGGDGGSGADADEGRATDCEAAGSSGVKRRRSPAENPPNTKRPMLPKVFDHILAMGKADKTIDDIIGMLVHYADQHGHRRGYKTACRHLRSLATDLQDLDADEDWIPTVMQYKDSLKKLPMGPGNLD